MTRPTSLLLVASFIVIFSAPAQDSVNLLKNGSFEGGLRYWYETEQNKTLVKGDAAFGDYAIRIEKGGIQSAAFELVPGKTVTISFSAKADVEMTMGLQCTPCGREIGSKAGLTWGMKAHHPFKIGTTWKRYSMPFTPKVPQDGFWPRSTYMLQIGDGDKPFVLDGVCVSYDAGTDGYVPRRAIEVQVDSPDLKGYRDESANLLEKGQTVTLIGSVSNPSTQDHTLTLRWQLIDYEGERPIGKATEQPMKIAAGKTSHATIQMPLSASGQVLARFSAIENDKVIDSSDLPLVSLPYPKSPRTPDPRERFGVSIFGPHNAHSVSKIGMSWSRWHPHMEWQDHQPKGPDSWVWYDNEIDALAADGISTDAVIYGRPKWAFNKDSDQLPKDMQWPENDPRWDDLTTMTAWDTYVVTIVKHYAGKPLIYEIENEPEFDGWDKKFWQYAKFTIRTARLIKQTDSKARVMVDNVYGIPSGLNRFLLEHGAGKYIDIISWHDYHEGWLADGAAMKRMRSALEDLGCGHVEIWFNEGWAYTNTAVDEPAMALTHLNAAQSTNAMVCSIAELTVNGQEKTILFHSGYEDHGMSFWDYCGPGTMLWDFYGYPLPLVPAWNTLVHHIGISNRIAFIRPEGANFCIFDDLRNGRGVMVAYVDREAKEDVVVDLPFEGLSVDDAMGNPVTLDGKKLTLSKTGRPVFIYSRAKTDGKTFAAALAPLDRKNAGFVSKGGSVKLPPAWEGSKKDSTEGNPALANGIPVWRLDQVWPVDPTKPENYHALAWRDGWWVPLKDGYAGQPKAELKDSAIRMEFRAGHSAHPGEKLCGLIFIASKAGSYRVSASAQLKLWDGNNPVRLTVLKKSKIVVSEQTSMKLIRDKSVLLNATVTLEANEELVLLPRIEGMFAGGDVTIRDLEISIDDNSKVEYRLPRAWEGGQKGSAAGNPVTLDGKPIWRVDQLWPDNPIMAEYYTPMIWNGTAWAVEKNGAGGQPEIKVENGAFHASVRGSWTGNEGQRIAGLIFVAPKAGIFHITGTMRSKPWEGGAKTFKLGVFKKDTQRAAEVKMFELPRNGDAVPIDLKVELTAGHEVVFLPLMPDWHNATTTSVEDLVIREGE